MGAFDAVMWGVEGDPLLRSVITVILQLDRAPDEAVLRDRIDRMTRSNPKLRQRAVGNAISLAPPRWETDPNFELDYHIRWQRLPRRGSDLSDVLELAEHVSEQDFDRARPLWEMTVVTGLVGGEAALIVKIHHSITDGVGGLMMTAVLFDLERHADVDLGPLPEAPMPNVADATGRLEQGIVYEVKETTADVTATAKNTIGLLMRAATDPIATALDAQQFGASAARMLAPQGEPLSDLMTDRSLSVAFSIVEAPLADLKAAARAAQVTLNDAFMAAVTGGLELYHEAHGSNPPELRVNMPISVRSDSDAGGGNKWVPARFALPIAVRDAAARMRQLHPILQQAQHERALGLSDVVYRLLTILPRQITTNVAGSLMKGVDFAATNVPGPPFAVYLAGAEVLAFVPFAPKAGAAVNVALMSYNGRLFFGINADRAAVEDPDQLTELISQSLESVLQVGVPTED